MRWLLIVALLASPSWGSMVHRSGKKFDSITLWVSGETTTGAMDSTECSSGSDTTFDTGSVVISAAPTSSSTCMVGNCLLCDVGDGIVLTSGTLEDAFEPNGDFCIVTSYQIQTDLTSCSQGTGTDPDLVSPFFAFDGVSQFSGQIITHSCDTGSQCEDQAGAGLATQDGTSNTTYHDTYGVEQADGEACDAQDDDDIPDNCGTGNPCVLSQNQEWMVVSCCSEYTAGNDRDETCWAHEWSGTGTGLEQRMKWERNHTTTSDLPTMTSISIGAGNTGTTFTGDLKVDTVFVTDAIIPKPWELVFLDQYPPGACP